jgi:hypothetical protein
MRTIRWGWFLSLFVLIVGGCGSSSNTGTGRGGAGGSSGGQAGSGSGGGGPGGSSGAGGGNAGRGGMAGTSAGGAGGGNAGRGGMAGTSAGGTGGGNAGRGGMAGTSAGGTGGAGGATFQCPRQSSSALRCQHGVQYCQTGSLPMMACLTLPAACGSTPSCSCIARGPCDTCSQSAAGDLEVIIAADCFTPDGSQ